MNRVVTATLVLLTLTACQAPAADPPQATAPATQPVAQAPGQPPAQPPAQPAVQPAAPTVGKLPHVEFDGRRKQVRVECEMLAVDAPLEFFCCVKGTNDYEAMIRSEVKPSDLHLALLAIGLKPGQPLQYSEAAKRWIPPQGPPLQMSLEYEKDGRMVSVSAWKWMRDVKTKKPAPPFTWVFTGSRVMPDGKYAADVTGYLVSIVNFDLTVIDIPQLASSSNDLLEWERNPDTTPKAGTKVTMVLEPAGAEHHDAEVLPTTQPVTAPTSQGVAAAPGTGNVEASISAAENVKKQAQTDWRAEVGRHADAMRDAAQSHYRIMQTLRSQQQKLIDEADRMQQTIDELEKEYQDLTAPRPDNK